MVEGVGVGACDVGDGNVDGVDLLIVYNSNYQL